MKYISFFLLAITCLSCTKYNTPSEPLREQVSMEAMPQVKGSFVKGPYAASVSGKAVIYKSPGNLYELALEDFSVSNGPDLKVYLSQASTPLNFYNLSSLKSVSGNQVYQIPSTVNLAEFQYVLIHCQQFNHLFAYAELINP